MNEKPLTDWEDIKRDIFTQEELSASELRVQLICSFIDARTESGMTQMELEKLSGVRQPVIARIETGVSTPRVETLQKLLKPLGKKLAIVPLEGDI